LGISPQAGTHKIGVVSQFLADHRPSNSLKAAEEFLQYIFDGNEVGLWSESAGTGLAIPSGEVFDGHVARNRAFLS
jgi:hypothetical protein